jgi:hypothetical protein
MVDEEGLYLMVRTQKLPYKRALTQLPGAKQQTALSAWGLGLTRELDTSKPTASEVVEEQETTKLITRLLRIRQTMVSKKSSKSKRSKTSQL